MADNQSNSGSNAGLFAVAFVILVAVVIGGFFLMQTTGSTVSKNNAVAGAANAVSDTANKVGNAADKSNNN